MKQSRTLRSLPNILSIHANVQTDAELDLWRSIVEPPVEKVDAKGSAVVVHEEDKAWLPHMIKYVRQGDLYSMIN